MGEDQQVERQSERVRRGETNNRQNKTTDKRRWMKMSAQKSQQFTHCTHWTHTQHTLTGHTHTHSHTHTHTHTNKNTLLPHAAPPTHPLNMAVTIWCSRVLPPRSWFVPRSIRSGHAKVTPFLTQCNFHKFERTQRNFTNLLHLRS
jgi:hypothetical protein